MSKELIKSKASQQYLRQAVTRLYNTRSTFDSLSPVKREEIKLQLNHQLTSLQTIHDAILSSTIENYDASKKDGEDDLETELNPIIVKFEEYNEKIWACFACLTTPEANYNSQQTGDENVELSESGFQKDHIKSPDVPYPTFSGEEGESLDVFLFQFEQIIDNFNYNPFTKYLILKGQLTGRAEFMIKDLKCCKQQAYDAAKDMLKDLFARKHHQKYILLSKLLS